MFKSHLDEQPVMTLASGLGQSDQDSPPPRLPVASVAAPVSVAVKPLLTMAIIAAVTYAVLKALKAKQE